MLFSKLRIDLKDSLSSPKSKKAIKLECDQVTLRLQQSEQRERETARKLQSAEQRLLELHKQVRSLSNDVKKSRKAKRDCEQLVVKQKREMEVMEAKMDQLQREHNRSLRKAMVMEQKLDFFKHEVKILVSKIWTKLSSIQGGQEEISPLISLQSPEEFTFDTAHIAPLR